ncbi:MAG TPA: nucleoside-diphosphate sugar epimerase, partial [Gammaproteobacteria bacterium]|nr:nucleoside-diphosphate sugar epimerase [Gammaproteobacteria bacterium]
MLLPESVPSQKQGQPRLWLLLGDKQGDNGQVYSVVEALGWDYQLKHLHMLDRYVLGKPPVGPSLAHIDRDRSDPLEPPWPDLIITIGLRPSNVALWIREQSGGRTRIVLLGKPSGMMKRFDLIVASAENHFPKLPNVLPVSLPLMRVDEQAVAAAATEWRARLATLPRPLIGVMVGGPTGP